MLANFETHEASRLQIQRAAMGGRARCSQWSWGFHKAKAFCFFLYVWFRMRHTCVRWSWMPMGSQFVQCFLPVPKGHLAHLDKKARTWWWWFDRASRNDGLVMFDKGWQGLTKSVIFEVIAFTATKSKTNKLMVNKRKKVIKIYVKS